MPGLYFILCGLLVVVSLLLVASILLHKGKGGGLSDMFGGGFSSVHGSSSVVERNLDRITLILGSLWIVLVIVLGLMFKHHNHIS